MTFFTPPPDPATELSNLFEGFLKSLGATGDMNELMKKFLPPRSNGTYRAAVHTRPKNNPDGTPHPYEFESIMTLLKGDTEIEVDGEQILTQELTDAYVTAAKDAVSSALYEAAFIKYSLEELKVPIMALMGQLARFRQAAAAREDKRLLLRYRPAASIEGVPTVNVYYVREGVEIAIGHWHIPGVMAHLMQIQYGMEFAARHESFSHELEDTLGITKLDERHLYLQGIQRTMIGIIESETQSLYESHEVPDALQ